MAGSSHEPRPPSKQCTHTPSYCQESKSTRCRTAAVPLSSSPIEVPFHPYARESHRLPKATGLVSVPANVKLICSTPCQGLSICPSLRSPRSLDTSIRRTQRLARAPWRIPGRLEREHVTDEMQETWRCLLRCDDIRWSRSLACR